jgi:hypothetical protein
MIFFRHVSFGRKNIHLVGLFHSKKSLEYLRDNLSAVISLKPSKFLVETSAKSLELSEFVWRSRSDSYTVDRFCEEEYYLNETLAIASRFKMGKEHIRILPIDVDPALTRRRLAKSALLHPIESLFLISRYHGKDTDISCPSEVFDWRRQFQKTCPAAFQILFSDRESYMADRILETEAERAVVLVGVSHVDALYNLIVDRIGS